MSTVSAQRMKNPVTGAAVPFETSLSF